LALVALETHKVVRRRLQMARVLLLALLLQRVVEVRGLLLGKLVALVAVAIPLVGAQVLELLDKVMLAVLAALLRQSMVAVEVVGLVLLAVRVVEAAVVMAALDWFLLLAALQFSMLAAVVAVIMLPA